ncbi:FCD domain-containing protein [Nocardioides sp. TF02-7]|uniref:FadR/GntR family transcriptional regulator n=1 Tax=Nocardioides sp. TF02-7 TaxID=2917724 RepID=UPI001F0517A4|nr:FCD domain-containing protein [Nocardioides sp. TF02-7]UMG94753.1 FCD domain-containing protein [Nocardioides sp. TF02-7]
MRHGGGATVRDFQRYAGLDLLPRLLVRGGRLDAGVARSVVEARTQIGPAIAAQAAERGGPVVAATLEPLLDRLASTDDPAEWQRLALEYWDVVVDGADSIVYRLMFNSLRAAYEPAVPALAALLTEEVGAVEPYRLLAAALAAGDPGTARAAAERLLTPTAQALLGALASLEEDDR